MTSSCHWNTTLTQDFTDAVAVLRDLIEPPLDVDKRLGVGHVVNDDDAVGVPVVAAHTHRGNAVLKSREHQTEPGLDQTC